MKDDDSMHHSREVFTMTFTGIIDRDSTVTIDGYSNRKTAKAAIKEFGRWIAKHVNEDEGKAIMDYPEESLLPASESCGGYFLEIEKVPGASEWDEEKEEMKYAAGEWYLVCRIVK